MDILAVVLFYALLSLFMIRAWKAHGRLSTPDRWALITTFAVVIATFVIARLQINWVIVPTAIWLIAVALLAGGVWGAALRWPELPWFAGVRPIRRVIGIGATLLGCALIIGMAVL